MQKQEQIEYHREIQEYLNSRDAYRHLKELIELIIIHKPQNPVDFLIKRLQTPRKQTIFVNSLPGLQLGQSILRLLKREIFKDFELIDVGEQFRALQPEFTQSEKKLFKSGLLVDSAKLNHRITDKIAQSNKNVIVEGFPKTYAQVLDLQSKGIAPDPMVFVAADEAFLKGLCKAKAQALKESGQKLTGQQILEDYKINTRKVKSFFKQYSQIDVSKQCDQEYLLSEFKRTLQSHVRAVFPRQNTQIMVVGAPLSGRTTLARKLAKKYNLVSISTSDLISNEIRKGSSIGIKIKDSYLNNDLIDEYHIQQMLEERISWKDCQMQGFVMEGYPKSVQQMRNIASIKMKPSIIIAINAPKAFCQKRCNNPIDKRYQFWELLREQMLSSIEKVYWCNPYLNQQHMFQDVCYEIEKKW